MVILGSIPNGAGPKVELLFHYLLTSDLLVSVSKPNS